MNWPEMLVKLVAIRQHISEKAEGGLYPMTLPEVAAGEDEILATEKTIGQEIDARYREFLRYANGWRAFFQSIDLFGTRQLAGEPNMPFARAVTSEFDSAVFEQEFGVSIEGTLPCGVGEQGDLFLMIVTPGVEKGSVIWASPTGLVDRWANFDEFYAGMVDYNVYLLNSLR